jgi:hypothetical protein
MPARRVLVDFGEMRRDIAAAHHAARQMSDAKVVTLPGTHHDYLTRVLTGRSSSTAAPAAFSCLWA